MKLGLGTGSTARHVLEVIAERRRGGALHDIIGAVTSTATERQARELGIPIAPLEELKRLDLGIDGADEVDEFLDLTKGLGGALLWEKIVATACDRFIVVVDETKLVKRLGTKAPIPVEVVPYAWKLHLELIYNLEARGELRKSEDGQPFITDGGHYIIDCHFADGVHNTSDIDVQLKMQPGIVETGLFIDLATAVVIAGERDVLVKERPPLE